MRFVLPAFALLAACSAEPPLNPLADAATDASPDVDLCRGFDAGGACTCPTPSRDYAGTVVCLNGSSSCFCPFPDASAEASVDAVAVADALPDASAPADAAPVSGDAIAVADAVADAPRDAAPDRYNCGEGVPPRCSDHGPCAACLPSAGGTVWCCRSGFCRPAIDRSSCE